MLINITGEAQTPEQLAEMPNAFETVTPTINDGQYYYIQFYYNGRVSYLTDRGLNKRVSTTDFMPSDNRLWTLVSANDEDDTHFKLKSKAGYYIGFARIDGATGNRYVCLESADANGTVTFTLQQSEDGYNFLDLNNNSDLGTNGLLGRPNNTEWSDQLSIIRNDNSGKQNSRMRFVKLKSNVAYIIYYRDNTVYDSGTLNSNSNAIGPNHYMTYSMTDSPDDISNILFTTTQQIVSSRKSITGNTKESWKLPTAAAYHKDGLWIIEKTGEGDNFQIRKYGTYDYLNRIDAPRKDGYTASIYSLNNSGSRSTVAFSSPDNNRYSSIRNVNTGNYLNYADGDGWYVLDYEEQPNTWQAGILPVEVPSPNQDDYYGVLLKVKRTDNRIKLTGQTNNPTITPLGGSTLDNLYGATFTPTANFTNVFQFINMPTGCYTKIVIRFGSPVPNGWHIHTYGGQFDNNVNLSGLTEYEVNLNYRCIFRGSRRTQIMAFGAGRRLWALQTKEPQWTIFPG